MEPAQTPPTPTFPLKSLLPTASPPTQTQTNARTSISVNWVSPNGPPQANFSFLELLDTSDLRARSPPVASLTGTVQVSRAPEEQEAEIRVVVSIATTAVASVVMVDFVHEPEWMQLLLPEMDRRLDADGEELCMDVAVGIFVHKGARLGSFEAKTANLDVVVDEGVLASNGNYEHVYDDDDDQWEMVGAMVADETSIWTARGDVSAAYLNSRKTRVDTDSGSISGTYALHDLLSLTSKSGSIDVTVEPKEADEEGPHAPADFVAKTRSGSIDAKFPSSSSSDNDDDYEIPERNYRNRVSTRSARIQGRYILGSSSPTTFSTHSGSTDVDVLPYSSELGGATLRTENHSGKTALRLRGPYVDNDDDDSASANTTTTTTTTTNFSPRLSRSRSRSRSQGQHTHHYHHRPGD